MKKLILISVVALLAACTPKITTTHVIVTAESGEKNAEQEPIVFTRGMAADAIVVDPEEERQLIDGFGGSLTESSAFVLACLDKEQREQIIAELFGKDGANFSLSRTHIGASDFSVEGLYSLAEKEGDTQLSSFTLAPDKEGFSRQKYPQIKDENYDLYHLILDVWNLKKAQGEELKLIASPWTAPAWMKDNGKYYEKYVRGGGLKEEYYQTFADYFVRYLDAWKSEGVRFWAVTPENEPQGNGGNWESMELSPAAEAEFIAKNLGPTLAKAGYGDVHILGFDQNIFEMAPYTEAIYSDADAYRYTHGMAIHWYGHTKSCLPEVLDSIHALYPDKIIIHTEGCIDNLGCDAWQGVQDPVAFKETDWFLNDKFWWEQKATDWAYSTPFDNGTHPAYSAVQRYAQYIIDGINHWMTGFADWNIVLDSIGGPNHVNNFCGAEVMVDYRNATVYFTPYYYALRQLSRSMRPGDVAIGVKGNTIPDLHVCAVKKTDGSVVVNMLNEAQQTKSVNLQIGDYSAAVTLLPNSLQTIQLNK